MHIFLRLPVSPWRQPDEIGFWGGDSGWGETDSIQCFVLSSRFYLSFILLKQELSLLSAYKQYIRRSRQHISINKRNSQRVTYFSTTSPLLRFWFVFFTKVFFLHNSRHLFHPIGIIQMRSKLLELSTKPPQPSNCSRLLLY